MPEVVVEPFEPIREDPEDQEGDELVLPAKLRIAEGFRVSGCLESCQCEGGEHRTTNGTLDHLSDLITHLLWGWILLIALPHPLLVRGVHIVLVKHSPGEGEQANKTRDSEDAPREEEVVRWELTQHHDLLITTPGRLVILNPPM